MRENYFTVPSTGRRIKIRPVSAEIIRGFSAERDDLPKRPTYTITYPGGETEEAEHDETTLETPEQREAFAAWVEAYRAADSDLARRWMRAIITLAINEEPADGWREQYEWLGIKVPDEPREQKLWWANNELLPTDDDKSAFGETVNLISTIRKEDLDRIERSFPGLLRWYTTQEHAGAEKRLADRDAVPGGEGDG